jgi:hypothetical protein
LIHDPFLKIKCRTASLPASKPEAEERRVYVCRLLRLV